MKRIAVAQRGVGTLCLTMLLMYFTAQIAMAAPVPGAAALVRISILLRCIILARSSATGLDSVATGLDLLSSKHISFPSGNIMTNGSPATSGELERKPGSPQDVASAIAALGSPVHMQPEQLDNCQQQPMTPCETAEELKDLEFKDAYDTLMHPQQRYTYDTHSSPGLMSAHARYTYDPHSSAALKSHARHEGEDSTKHVFVSGPTESPSFAASRQRGRSLLRETYWPKQNRQPPPPRVGGGGGGSRSGGLLKCQHPDCPRIAGFFLSPRPRLSKSESQPPINNELATLNEVTSSASVYLDRGKALLRRFSGSAQALLRLS
jgi:hypothetical protein